MPKERLHILLADKTLQHMESKGMLSFSAPELRTSFLLGAISPDTLFYDLPFFRLDSVGNSIHRLEKNTEFLHRWINEEVNNHPQTMRAWTLGVISHLLVDTLWHPLINSFAIPPSPPCRNRELSASDCHHWLESELEAFWIERMGPHDGYIPLLKELGRRACASSRYSEYLENLLVKLKAGPVPGRWSIRWCYFWQTLLLRCFSSEAWGKAKPWLQSHKTTRSYGALAVPLRPSLPKDLEVFGKGEGTAQTLFDPAFWEETVTELAGRLTSLPVRF